MEKCEDPLSTIKVDFENNRSYCTHPNGKGCNSGEVVDGKVICRYFSSSFVVRELQNARRRDEDIRRITLISSSRLFDDRYFCGID